MGSGFKDWAAGDVLTAADVDGYLMRQTIMTFATETARDTALSAVLDEGMYCFTEDTDTLWYYTGSAWVSQRTSAWTSFTPSWTNLTVGDGTNLAFYRYVDNDLEVSVRFQFGSTSSIGGNVSLTLPNSETAHASITSFGTFGYIDVSAGSLIAAALKDVYVKNGTTSMQVSSADSGIYGFTATSPITWTTSDVVYLHIKVALDP